MGVKVLASQAAAQRVTSLCRHGRRVWVGFADGVVITRDAATGNLDRFISGRSDAFVPSCIFSTVSGVLIGYRNGSIRLFPILPNQSTQNITSTSISSDSSSSTGAGLIANLEPIEVLKGFDDGHIVSIACARNIVYYVKKGMLYMLDLATRTSVNLEDPFATAASRVTSILLSSSNVSDHILDSLWVFSTSATGSQSSFTSAVSSTVSQNHLTVIPVDAKTGVADSSQAKKEVIRIPNSFLQGVTDEDSSNQVSGEVSKRQMKANPQAALAGSAVVYSAQLSGLSTAHIVNVCLSGQIYIWRVNDRKLVGWRQSPSDLKGTYISRPIYLSPRTNESQAASYGALALFAADGGIEIVGLSQGELKASITSPNVQKHRNAKSSGGSSTFSSNFVFTSFPSTSLFPGSIPVAVEVDSQNELNGQAWRVWVATALSSESTHIMELSTGPQTSAHPADSHKSLGERCRLHDLSSLRIVPSSMLFEEVVKQTSVDSKSAIQKALNALNVMRTQLSRTETERAALKSAIEVDRSKFARLEEKIAELTASLTGMDECVDAKIKEEKRIAYEQGQKDASSKIEQDLDQDLETLTKEHEDLLAASKGLTEQVSDLTDSLNQKTSDVISLQERLDSSTSQIEILNEEIASLKSQISKLEADSDHHNSEKADLQKEVDALKEDIQGLKQQEQAKESEILNLREELQAKESSVDNSQIENLKETIKRYEDQIQSLNLDLESERTSSSSFQTQLEEKTTAHKQLESSHEEAKAEIERLKSQLDNQQVQLEEKEELIKNLSANSLTESENLKKEVERLSKALSDSCSQQSQTASELEALQKELATTSQTDSELAHAREQLSKAQAQLSQADAEIESLREQLSSASQTDIELEKLRKQVSESSQVEAELDNLRTLKSQTDTDIEKLKEIIREQKLELANCQDTMADQRRIIKSLEESQKSPDVETTEVNEEKARADKLQEEKDALATQLTFSEMKMSTLEHMNKELTEEVNSLKTGLDQIQSEVEDRIFEAKRDQHRDWESRLEECVTSLNDITRSYFELREEYSRAQREISQLKESEKASPQQKDSDATPSNLPEESEVLDNLEEMTRQYKALRQTYTVLEKEKSILKTDLESARSTCASAEEQLSKVTEELKAVEVEKSQLQSMCEQLKDNLNEASQLFQQKVVEFESFKDQLAEGLAEVEEKAQMIEKERDDAIASLKEVAKREEKLNEALQTHQTEAAKALEKIQKDAEVLKLQKEVSAWLPESNIDTRSQIDSLSFIAQPNARILDGTMASRTSVVKSVNVEDEEIKERVIAAIKNISNSVETSQMEHKKISEISTTQPDEQKSRLQSLMEQINAIGGEGFALQIQKPSEGGNSGEASAKSTLISTGLMPRTASGGKSVLEIVHEAAKQYVEHTSQDGDKHPIQVVETDALFIPALNDLNLQLAKLAKESELVDVIKQELLRLQNFEIVARDAVRQLYVMIRRFENITDLVAVKKSAAKTSIRTPLLSPVEAEQQFPSLMHMNSASILASLKVDSTNLPDSFRADPEQFH